MYTLKHMYKYMEKQAKVIVQSVEWIKSELIIQSENFCFSALLFF